MRKVLIANRGEIAVRIARACRERGLGVVAVYAGPDAGRMHVLAADEAVCLDLDGHEAGSGADARPVAAYLSVGRVIDAARRSGADAVHPGYGFLSERPALAAACVDAGLTFIGPPADVIARMGSKLEARRLMESAGVPCVPGARPDDQSIEALRAAATQVGVPLLVKASAGGGGKGMRVVERIEDLDEALGAARREAESAFGDGTLYIERRIDRPRHIEVQIIADAHGATLHLGERECSLQRRHQKVIEEAPSPVVSPALRARLGAAAVAAARAAGYRNAGTVEFLLDGDDDEAPFYFLEMNTRLQVEHPDHRTGDRAGPGAVATRRGGRPAAGAVAADDYPSRPCRRVPAVCGGAVAGIPAAVGHHPALPSSRKDPVFAWTAACGKATSSRPTSTHSSPS